MRLIACLPALVLPLSVPDSAPYLQSGLIAMLPAPQVPPGCKRYTVSLRKPLGLVLEQDAKTGGIYVASASLFVLVAS